MWKHDIVLFTVVLMDLYGHVMNEDETKKIQHFRVKMDNQCLHSALESFSKSRETANLPGVYEIRYQGKIIYIGGNPHLSNIRDSLNAHFSGNDGLPIGAWLSGPAKNHWQAMSVRWMTCSRPHEVVFYLLQDHYIKYGTLPQFNKPPSARQQQDL